MLNKLSVLLIVYIAANTSLATPVHTGQVVDRAGISPGPTSSNILSGNSMDNTIGDGIPSVLGSLTNGNPIGPIAEGLISPIGVAHGIIG